jgi:hypothetical protein
LEPKLMVPLLFPPDDEPLALALLLLALLLLELQAARAPGTVTSPAAAASPFKAARLLKWRSSWEGEGVCFIATPLGLPALLETLDLAES